MGILFHINTMIYYIPCNIVLYACIDGNLSRAFAPAIESTGQGGRLATWLEAWRYAESSQNGRKRFRLVKYDGLHPDLWLVKSMVLDFSLENPRFDHNFNEFSTFQ